MNKATIKQLYIFGILGLADAKSVKSITITDTKGNTQIIESPTINTTVVVN